ncbi:MAG: preprotein translocase subunit SecE [Desulfurivibrionaceae bacterium]
MAAKKNSQPKKKQDKVGQAAEKKTGSKIGQIPGFAREVKAEFQKIAWPHKKQTIATTGVVIFLVFLVSIYLGTVDLIFGKLVGLLIQ